MPKIGLRCRSRHPVSKICRRLSRSGGRPSSLPIPSGASARSQTPRRGPYLPMVAARAPNPGEPTVRGSAERTVRLRHFGRGHFVVLPVSLQTKLSTNGRAAMESC